MPATDLKTLREYVANVLDYNPDNPAYASQVDDLLNEANRQICQAKPFTFINKVVEKNVYADVDIAAVTFNSGIEVATAPPFTFQPWMAGQVITANGREFTIFNVVSDTEIRISEGWPDLTGAYPATVINRFIDLPSDCTTVLAVARRSQTRTPDDPGLLSNLTRYEDEWWNLPLGEVNLPTYWVFHDPFYNQGPRRLVEVQTGATAPGKGTRTVEFCGTLVFAGRESAPGEIVRVTATDSQSFVVTPEVKPVDSGQYKNIYFRAPEHGMNAWRLLQDQLSPGNYLQNLAPNDVLTRTYTTELSLSELTTSEGLWSGPRMIEPDGFTQRIRLYPRQDRDYVFSIRYMQRTPVMREDNDVSLIPPAHRMIIAYKALADVLVKHDNPTQAEMFKRRFEAQQMQLEKRYLVSPSRRIVKGNWLTNMEPNGFSRFTTLVHT